MKQKIAWFLGVLIVLSLIATSFVSARNYLNQDVMTSPLVTIPEGSTHTSYDGDYITSDRTISLTSGWSTNLPYNTCAVAARLGFRDGVVGHWASLRPDASGTHAVLARTQGVWQWTDNSGIVPINTYHPTVRLDINSAGYVYIEITGYWVCDDYMPPPRPTLAP